MSLRQYRVKSATAIVIFGAACAITASVIAGKNDLWICAVFTGCAAFVLAVFAALITPR